MAKDKNPYRQFHLSRAKERVSKSYDTDNPDLEPTRQEARDKNEVPERLASPLPSRSDGSKRNRRAAPQ